MKFVSPKNDVAFKKIFGNEDKKEILISFLNSVLNLIGDKEIQDIEILNPWQAPRIKELKHTVLDVRAKDRRGITFIVEMQVERMSGLRKRFAYYVAQAYASQIERGEDYPKLNQVIFIGILDFAEFESEHWLTRHILINTETCGQEIKDLEFNFIELPKFCRKEHELRTVLEKWIYFIKHAEELGVVPSSADTPALRSAYATADSFNWSREEMELYDYWGIKAQDERGKLQAAYEKGEFEGRKEGKLKGRLEGRLEGESAKAKETALRMLSKGYTVSEITELTGLSADDINVLRLQNINR